MFSRTVVVVSLLVALQAGTATAQSFTNGTLDVGPTIGLGGIGGGGLSIGGRIEKGIRDLPELNNGVLGISGFVQHYSFDCGAVDCGSITFIGATANYHFVLSDRKWDPFVGLGLGFGMWSEPDGFAGAGTFGGVTLAGNLGVRYYLSPKLAAYADVATGAAALNLGVMFKLR